MEGTLCQQLHTAQDERVLEAGLEALKKTSGEGTRLNALLRWISKPLAGQEQQKGLAGKVADYIGLTWQRQPAKQDEPYRQAEDLLRKDDFDGLQQLLDEHPYLVFERDRDYRGETLLHAAMYRRHQDGDTIRPSLKLCELLLDRGASLDALDRDLLLPEFHTFYPQDNQEQWLMHQLGLESLLEGQLDSFRQDMLSVCRWMPISSDSELRGVLDFLSTHPMGRAWAAANPNRISAWIAVAVRFEMDRAWVIRQLSVWEKFLTPNWAMSACFSAVARDWSELLSWLLDRGLVPPHYALPFLGYTQELRQGGFIFPTESGQEATQPIFGTSVSQAMRLESLSCLEVLWKRSGRSEASLLKLARLQETQQPHSRYFWHWVYDHLVDEDLRLQVGQTRLAYSVSCRIALG